MGGFNHLKRATEASPAGGKWECRQGIQYHHGMLIETKVAVHWGKDWGTNESVSMPAYLGPVTSTYTVCNTKWQSLSISAFCCNGYVCYNFFPFSCILPCLCGMISLLLLCSFTQGDWPLLTCLPVILFFLHHFPLVSHLITGLSLPLIISLMVVMFFPPNIPSGSTTFHLGNL